jgi:hypothetical protein
MYFWALYSMNKPILSLIWSILPLKHTEAINVICMSSNCPQENCNNGNWTKYTTVRKKIVI